VYEISFVANPSVVAVLCVEPVLEVPPTGNDLGFGRYWQKEEVEVAGTMCAAIRLHDALDSGANQQRFASECKMMSSLRHPHIVTFLGTSYLHGSLALVTEKLPYNLTNILSGCPDIPLCLKYSMLCDVAQGLIYLHTHSIIHRDISIVSILLNSALEAKICDFSAAKYMGDPEPVYDDPRTQYPGTLVYMPPEAAGGIYDTSLDICSFGVLALGTLIQEYPGDIGEAVVIGPDGIVARSEVERREKYFMLLYSQLNHRHPLVQMIEQCLANDSKERPVATVILQTLKELLLIVSEHEQSRAKIKTMEMIMRDGDQEVSKIIEKVQGDIVTVTLIYASV